MQLNYKQTNEITLIMCLSFNLSELVDKQLFSKYEKRCQKKNNKKRQALLQCLFSFTTVANAKKKKKTTKINYKTDT